MAAGDELRAKAREFERAQRFADALDAYGRLVEAASGAEAAVLWQRIASIQDRSGDAASSLVSYSRAVELYVSSGQRNNALAACLQVADKLPVDSPIALTRLKLALELGYPVFARDAIGAVFLQAVQGDPTDETIELITGFLTRHGREPRFTPADLIEGLPADAEHRIATLLSAVWQSLRAAGEADIADRVRAEIIRIQPDADPAPTAARPPRAPPDPEPVPPLPIIETNAIQDESGPTHVPLLEGLEPTHAGFERERDEREIVDLPEAATPLGLVGQAPFSSEPPDDDVDQMVELDDEEYEDEPLPLLIPTDRARANDELSIPAWSPESTDAYEADTDTLEDLAKDSGFDAIGRLGMDGPHLIPELDVPAITKALARIAGREVEPSDPASHYDVGVAFKEMGMTEDALARLTAALAGGYNPAATLEVIGEILVDQNRADDAARILGFARSTGIEFDEGMAGVLYWLARSDEMLGRSDTARDLFSRVLRVAPSFRDASERLAALPVHGF